MEGIVILLLSRCGMFCTVHMYLYVFVCYKSFCFQYVQNPNSCFSYSREKDALCACVYVCMHWLAHSAVRDNQPFRVAAMPVMQ